VTPGVTTLSRCLTGCEISWAGVHSTPVVEFSFGKGRKVHPLEALRRRLTRGLEVAASDQEVRRGGEVEALVTISSARKLGDVEVGVVCTESYDELNTNQRYTDGTNTTSTSRVTSDDVAHETWSPVETVSGVQSVRFTIPPDAPFSYRGDCLSFKWELVARGRRSRGLDRQARSEFSVLP